MAKEGAGGFTEIDVAMAQVTIEVEAKGNIEDAAHALPTQVLLRRVGPNGSEYATGWQVLSWTNGTGRCSFTAPADMNRIEFMSLPPGFFFVYPPKGVIEGGIPNGKNYCFVFTYARGRLGSVAYRVGTKRMKT